MTSKIFVAFALLLVPFGASAQDDGPMSAPKQPIKAVRHISDQQDQPAAAEGLFHDMVISNAIVVDGWIDCPFVDQIIAQMVFDGEGRYVPSRRDAGVTHVIDGTITVLPVREETQWGRTDFLGNLAEMAVRELQSGFGRIGIGNLTRGGASMTVRLLHNLRVEIQAGNQKVSLDILVNLSLRRVNAEGKLEPPTVWITSYSIQSGIQQSWQRLFIRQDQWFNIFGRSLDSGRESVTAPVKLARTAMLKVLPQLKVKKLADTYFRQKTTEFEVEGSQIITLDGAQEFVINVDQNTSRALVIGRSVALYESESGQSVGRVNVVGIRSRGDQTQITLRYSGQKPLDRSKKYAIEVPRI